MTKTPRFLLLALLAIVVSACEETVDITDAIYRERLVVESVLDAGDTLDILFTKTMPINQPYSKAAAALVDVTGTITAELGSVSQRYDLVHIGEGHYTAEGIALVPGARYTFVATWRGRTVRGSTRIPLEADVDTMEATPAQWHWEGSPEEMFNVRGVVTPRAGEVYLITTAVRQPWTGDLHVNTTYGGRLARMRDTTTNGRVVLIDEWYSFSRHDDLLGAVVSYDEPYYEFQRTYYRGDDMGPFGSGSDNVDWTVEGDGIGLFIGRNITMRPIED